ncbi:MAG: diguanylate cyclase [Lachnospiraceae bacterium]|nr:diguanylate cyclase [Lachnospiraceae bacterium]
MQKNKILIVDDDKANLDVLNHILKNDYTVYVAKSGEMAVKRAVSDQPDLILLDIIMPDMSGYDVLKVLKEDETTKSIPIIFITALNSSADEERGFLLGAVDYIVKPFNNSVLKARIRIHIKALEQARAIENFGTADVLTEIANRRQFDERLACEWDEALRNQKSLSLLSIDIDMMQQYNQTYGYLQGDVLLQTIAKEFYRFLRSEDDLVARTGGEEFAFILPDTDLKTATDLAREIHHAVEIMEIPSMGTLTTQITVSIGIATKTPTAGEEALILLEEANKELSRAQDAGGNQIMVG